MPEIDLLTVSVSNASAHFWELTGHVRAGGQVRVLDGRVPGKVVAHIVPPGQVPVDLGDIDLIAAGQHARKSEIARERMEAQIQHQVVTDAVG